MSRILFADDDPAMRQLVHDALSAAGHEVRVVPDGHSALAAVRDGAPDLVVLDYRMGATSGFEVCRHLKADSRYEHIPVLILTAQGEIENRLLGFEAGADDYLPKPFDARELVARARALLRLTRSGLERNPTTGLPGGAAIEREFEKWQGTGESFAVCYLDLDFFKAFNDRFGFPIADALIRAVGEILVAITRGSEAFPGHVGGDDFVLLCAPEQAVGLCRRAREHLTRRLPQFVPPDVVREGSYRARGRGGELYAFPLTQLSAAIAYVPSRGWNSLREISDVVAEAKRLAKAPESGGIAEIRLEAR
jgi:PleD family two-component response regulator